MESKHTPEWKLIPHSYQIADTGDYGGHYELTDGKTTLITYDDPYDETTVKAIVKSLNDSGCSFYCQESDALGMELSFAKQDVKELRELNAEMLEALEWVLQISETVDLKQPVDVEQTINGIKQMARQQINKAKGGKQ